jgi:hypothetical protein
LEWNIVNQKKMPDHEDLRILALFSDMGYATSKSSEMSCNKASSTFSSRHFTDSDSLYMLQYCNSEPLRSPEYCESIKSARS